MDFGSSGSGVVREWKNYDTVEQLDGTSRPVYQYSFAGPLTMSKGCDEAIELRRDDTKLRDYFYRGSNPVVVTDATCYMDWIAEQYQLRLDYDYERKASCSQSSGDKQDIDKDTCVTANTELCDWTLDFEGTVWDSCRLYAEEGIAKNVFQCITRKIGNVVSNHQIIYSMFVNFTYQRYFSTCSNNCRGVDPNSIIGAGVAPAVLGGSNITK